MTLPWFPNTSFIFIISKNRGTRTLNSCFSPIRGDITAHAPHQFPPCHLCFLFQQRGQLKETNMVNYASVSTVPYMKYNTEKIQFLQRLFLAFCPKILKAKNNRKGCFCSVLLWLFFVFLGQLKTLNKSL